jgi:hypothetical protein
MEKQRTNKIDIAKVEITKAKETDAEEVYALVSAAYIIEVGDSGIQYKTNNRYLGVEQAAKEIKDSI